VVMCLRPISFWIVLIPTLLHSTGWLAGNITDAHIPEIDSSKASGISLHAGWSQWCKRRGECRRPKAQILDHDQLEL